MKWPGPELCTQAECEEDVEPRAEPLAVLGKCVCSEGGKLLRPVPTLSHLPLLQVPQPLLPLLLPCLSGPHCLSPLPITSLLLLLTSMVCLLSTVPPSLKTCLSSTSSKSLHRPSLFPDISLHQMCPAHPLLCIPSSRPPKYLAVLYLIPKEPINSERPAFSWVHSLLFSNNHPYFK